MNFSAMVGGMFWLEIGKKCQDWIGGVVAGATATGHQAGSDNHGELCPYRIGTISFRS